MYIFGWPCSIVSLLHIAKPYLYFKFESTTPSGWRAPRSPTFAQRQMQARFTGMLHVTQSFLSSKQSYFVQVPNFRHRGHIRRTGGNGTPRQMRRGKAQGLTDAGKGKVTLIAFPLLFLAGDGMPKNLFDLHFCPQTTPFFGERGRILLLKTIDCEPRGCPLAAWGHPVLRHGNF